MDFIRQTVTLQISAPAHAGHFEPSSWDWGELLELPSDMVQVLDFTTPETLDAPEDKDEDLITCAGCGYTLRQDAKGTWIDFTDGDVCYDDVQHLPLNN